jgi:hypothetical protein
MLRDSKDCQALVLSSHYAATTGRDASGSGHGRSSGAVLAVSMSAVLSDGT